MEYFVNFYFVVVDAKYVTNILESPERVAGKGVASNPSQPIFL